MHTAIIIPARFGSSRLPGKPLHDIKGKPMLERVVRVAELAGLGKDITVAVATDNEKILALCNTLGVSGFMTDPDLRTGTDRVHAVCEQLSNKPDFILNLQGDAPFTSPNHLASMIEAAESAPFDVVTPVVQLDWQALDQLAERKKTPAAQFSGTTCVRSPEGRAYWFSKNIIPAIRPRAELEKSQALSPVYRHIGLYGYRYEALQRIVDLPSSPYETLEGLEQLRFLEAGMHIHTVVVKPAHISMSGIDTEQDVELACQLIEQHGDPFVEVA